MHTKFNSAQKQEGMTFIGIVIMFLFIGFLLLAVLRIFPLYYENLAVNKILTSFEQEYKEKSSESVNKMRAGLQKRLDVQGVINLKADDIEFKKTRKGYAMDASYKPVVNYLANLNFMVDFDHVIELEK